MEFFFCKAVKGHRIGDSKTYKKEGADERPSGWKEASEPCLKTHLHCEHSIFLRVCFFELSLKEGQVSRGVAWSCIHRGNAIYTEIVWLLDYTWAGGWRWLKAGAKHPEEPPLGWRQIPGRWWQTQKHLRTQPEAWPGIGFRDKGTVERGPNSSEPKNFSKSLPARGVKD